jgi:7,8-dihydropterin-6-yl-methyl-4-(beta-D-ribofuranosyl)aminobenzene 5'-phosphate synthase
MVRGRALEMEAMMVTTLWLRFGLLFMLMAGPALGAASKSQVTILYDAFSSKPGLQTDWGFAALIETNGKRILFDTGNDAARLEHNVRSLGVDLTRLDMVVISHRHWDHTAGLAYVLRINPNVPVYVPEEEFFGGPTPASFFKKDAAPELPKEMRYFNGQVPGSVMHGSAWPNANLVRIAGATQIVPGVRLIVTTSDRKGTKELEEVSMLIDTPRGAVLVVGCSHPGIDTILANATSDGTHVHEIFGGIHELLADKAEIDAMVVAVADQYRVDAVALGHCSGEATFVAFRKRYGKSYVYAGVGEIIAI